MTFLQRFIRSLRILIASAFASVALFLILTDILDELWRFEDFLPGNDPGDIKKYVLFSKHKHQGFEVVTGVQFASSRNRTIEKQWCYVSKKGSVTASNQTLHIADVNGADLPKINTFSNEVLASFDLTPQTLNPFVKSHCRFQ
ncbi:conserved hypothetical protein [Roseibium sp. TrichSKD4]|uniref:hypothetical protein n=1 Tax=Roseibium sp. TrichSKD4 TaxID=744980 RepID=UPI0001E5654F|nr:hypothetical protein [Roseibium sp. TrichSKD4]EFO34078.1 conserved hypothetical protein [Roseibium sp. TrichSKD4]